MKLPLNPQEAEFLRALYVAAERAKHDLDVAFAAACRARGLTTATLVALHPDAMDVDAPDTPEPDPPAPRLVA
jgi:ATP-dependent exoDNAse (exonuclease V) beta subunit